MSDYDVFNGDADGICALVQLRNVEPRDAILVTGVKHDISLLQRIPAEAGDRIVVLAVSLDKYRHGLLKALDAGADIFYVDRHFAGVIPPSTHLVAKIDTVPDVCTSILVNGHLRGKFAERAVVGAFGDNPKTSARKLADAARIVPRCATRLAPTKFVGSLRPGAGARQRPESMSWRSTGWTGLLRVSGFFIHRNGVR